MQLAQPKANFAVLRCLSQPIQQGGVGIAPLAPLVSADLFWHVWIVGHWHSKRSPTATVRGHPPLPESLAKELQNHFWLVRFVTSQNRNGNAVCVRIVIQKILTHAVRELGDIFGHVGSVILCPICNLDVLVRLFNLHAIRVVGSQTHLSILICVLQHITITICIPGIVSCVHGELRLALLILLRAEDITSQIRVFGRHCRANARF